MIRPPPMGAFFSNSGSGRLPNVCVPDQTMENSKNTVEENKENEEETEDPKDVVADLINFSKVCDFTVN